MSLSMKICPRCGIRPRERNGAGCYCVGCRRDYDRQWRLGHLDAARRHWRDYYSRHRESIRARRRDAARVAPKDSRTRHREHQRTYYYAHRDEILFRRKLRACGIGAPDTRGIRDGKNQRI